jgi:AcrR family transcriptional regulator
MTRPSNVATPRRRPAPMHKPRGARPAWRRDPDGRRQRVLTAASRLFGHHGYTNVTTATIAEEAGVSEGTIYHYFRSKDALACAAAARYGRGFADAMFDGFDASTGGPDVDAIIRRAFGYVRYSDPSFGVFLLAEDTGPSLPAKQANRAEIVTRLTAIFTDWRSKGLIRPAEPRILAELCFGLVEAGLRECYAREKERSPATEDAYVSEVAQCIRGMLAPTA